MDYPMAIRRTFSRMKSSELRDDGVSMSRAIHGRSQILAAAIDASLPRHRDRVCAGSLAALALMAALGGASHANATSTYLVTTAADTHQAGQTTLREAVAQANATPGSIVAFDPSLVGSTITLTNGEIPITTAMRIQGLGANRLAVSGNDTSAIFEADCSSTPTPVSVDIYDITLTHGYVFGFGGALFSRACYTTIAGATISNSHALVGGGIYQRDGGELKVLSSRIVGNTAQGYPSPGYLIGSGGGIGAVNASVVIISSTISGNSAAHAGGGIYSSGANLFELLDSLVTNNSADPPNPGDSSHHFGGGGVALVGGTTSGIDNTTVTGNFSYVSGGGVALLDATAASNTTMLHSTIAGNTTSDDISNGILAHAGGTFRLYNSIVANNFSLSGAYVDDLFGTFTVSGSLIENPGISTINVSSASLFGLDPRLGALRDNGGPTFSMLPDANSPVINAGHNPPGLDVDQRGLPRSVPSGLPDMGAVERQYPEDIIFRNGFDPP